MDGNRFDDVTRTLARSGSRRQALKALAGSLVAAIAWPHRAEAARCPRGQRCRRICCSAGTTCCGSYCADLQTNLGNCGACGNDCSQQGGGACCGGICCSRYASTDSGCCNGVCPMEVDCGFETTNFYDPQGCTLGCTCTPPPGSDCPTGCGTPTADGCVCDPNQQFCTGNVSGCRDLRVDAYNCGSCGNVCGGGLIPTGTCVNGECVL